MIQQHQSKSTAKRAGKLKRKMPDMMKGNGKVIGQYKAAQEGSQSTQRLDQFMSFVKDNWKGLLTEVVTAGVAAYLSHGSSKKRKTTRAHVRH